MKEEQRSRTIRDMLFALAATLLFALAAGCFYDCYYDLNDDVLIKDILAGTYTGTPEGRNIQMLYPIGFLISVLYRLSPALPWYGIFLCACHIVCFLLIGKRAIAFVNGFIKKSLILLFQSLLFAGLLLWELIYVQYSVTCALLTAAGVFLFYTTDDELSAGYFIRRNIVSMVLVILGFYMRTDAVALSADRGGRHCEVVTRCETYTYVHVWRKKSVEISDNAGSRCGGNGSRTASSRSSL
jgi:hypothetical protein